MVLPIAVVPQVIVAFFAVAFMSFSLHYFFSVTVLPVDYCLHYPNAVTTAGWLSFIYCSFPMVIMVTTLLHTSNNDVPIDPAVQGSSHHSALLCLTLLLISCQLIIVAFKPCLLLCCSCSNHLQHCMTCQQEIHWCFFCLLLPLPWFTFAIAATDHGATTAVEYCQHQGHCTSISPLLPCLYFLLFSCRMLHQWPMHLTLALQLPLQLPLQLSLQLPLPRQLPSTRQHNCQCCQLVDFFMFFPLFQLLCLHRSCSAHAVTVSVIIVVPWQQHHVCKNLAMSSLLFYDFHGVHLCFLVPFHRFFYLKTQIEDRS